MDLFKWYDAKGKKAEENFILFHYFSEVVPLSFYKNLTETG